MRDVKKILIGVLTVLAILQFVEFASNWIPLKPLAGVVEEDPWPGFSVQSLKTQKFQDYVSNYSGYNFGFRPLFVRLNNQFYYSFFGKSPYSSLVIGKDDYLFERSYIDSYFGDNFLGYDAIDRTMLKMDTIRSFMRQYGAELVIVVTPNKADYFSEYIPAYLVQEKETTNYDYFGEQMNEKGFHVLDANAWFKEMKHQAAYPLVPRKGVHWSVYGSTLFADSLVKYIEGVLGRELYHFSIDSIEYPRKPRESDKDLEDLMNVFTSDNDCIYAYPLTFQHDANADGFKPDMLVIGDSFFWNIYQGYLNFCFNEVVFWYYFNSIFPKLPDKVATTREIDIVRQSTKKDVVVLMTSSDNLKNFGFGFVDYMYNYLKMDPQQKYQHLIPRYVRSINNNQELLELIKVKAADKGISLDSMIYLDACWLANQHVQEFGPKMN